MRAAGGGKIIVVSLGFPILFETSLFRIKMIIMRGLGAILGHLGPLLGASWADLGSSWAPKRPQEGGQDDPKMIPKRHYFFIEFGCDFDANLGRPRRRVVPARRGETSRSACIRWPLATCFATCGVFSFRNKVVKKVSATDSQHALACCAGGFVHRSESTKKTSITSDRRTQHTNAACMQRILTYLR